MITPATRTLVVGDKPRRKIRRYQLQSKGGEPHELQAQLVRVGSRPGNDLVLDDSAVSRIHFEIIADEIGFRIRDLDSRNGTWVDGYRVVEMYLRSGSVVRAGGTELRFSVLDDEVDIPAASSSGYGSLVGSSLPMRELYAIVERAAPTDVTVLISGETGTGKELVARALHERSARSQGPFVVLDCGAVPGNLLESEVFGHEKGAFTGAHGRRIGLLEEADQGTLFIDEVGELPIELQPKLLRALDQREIRRLGARDTVALDIRVVAATNRDLAVELNRGSFREDLFYRLAVVQLTLPPLRDRREDIRALTEHFVRKALHGDGARAAEMLSGIDEENWKRLQNHPWPGNVRQLRNVIERTLALSEPSSLGFDLPGSEVANVAAEDLPDVDLDRPFVEQKAEVLAGFERAYLEGLLARHDGNFSRAAAAAGIDRMYFKRLLKKYR
jgi:DNA-binding NtrC family response regulator